MSALIAVLLGCIWKHSVHGQPRRILSFVVAKDADWDLALKKKKHDRTVMSWRHSSMLCRWLWHKLHGQVLCLHLKYSMWDRGRAGSLTSRIVDTQVPPALSHSISLDIYFTEHPLFSDSNRPSDFNALLCSSWVHFTRGWADTPWLIPTRLHSRGM